MWYIESFGGIIYIKKNDDPIFLVIKRQALSKKIEWTAPKWKSQEGEDPIQTAKREIMEETSLNPDLLIEKWKLGDFIISFVDTDFEKKVTYFLFEYKWKPQDVRISDSEWYLWVYNWLPINKVLNLVTYKWLRELYRKWYIIAMKN
jgi:8-oxo-dGTP pyrophosphatase MutT (NUDIX family)